MKSERRCYMCGELGHIARHCKKYYENIPRCYRCYRSGHLAYECNNRHVPQSIQCYRCQGYGHIAKHCTKILHDSRHKHVKSSTSSKNTVSRPLNSSTLETARQHASRTTATSSAKPIQLSKSKSAKQK
ncbi:unnamed protein product, partial [Rotaria sp. Silwood1]